MSTPRPFLVGGQWRHRDECLPVVFPYDGTTIDEVSLASDEDLEEAVQAAVRGFETTRKLLTHARRRILMTLLGLMERRSEELIKTLVLEGGKTLGVARGEVGRARETVRVSASEAERINGEVISIDWTEAGENRLGLVRHLPLGPILGITPFNYPLNLACHKLAPRSRPGTPSS
jgi:acyl-CoA reductase-like NAD-dependent aldehyde dehydrogenase